MRVNLLPPQDAGRAGSHISAVLLAPAGSSQSMSSESQSDQIHDRLERERRHDEAVASALAPTGSADVIQESERRIDRTSRAHRRQVSHDAAADRFRDGRRAFRQALSDARRSDARPVESDAASAGVKASAKHDADSQPDHNSDGAARGLAGKQTRPDQAPTTNSTSRQNPPETPAPVAAASRSVVGAQPSSPQSPAISTPVAARLAVANIIRSAAGAASRTTTPSASRTNSTDAGKPTGVAVGGRRGGRVGERFQLTDASKARAAKAADNARREANIERLVRVVRSHFHARNSHTVMRLDPPELGSLRLQLDLRGDALSLRIDAATDVARRLLSEHVDKLRDGLETSGIHLERIDVRPPMQPLEVEHEPTAQHDEPSSDTQDGSARSDAEHSESEGKEPPPAETPRGVARENTMAPAAESLVNVVA